MKKLLALLLVCLFVTIPFLASCDKGETPSEGSSVADVDATAKDLTGAVMNTVTFPEMVEGSARLVASYYGIDDTKLTDYSVYLESSGAMADEVAVFIFASEADASAAVALLESRKQDQIDSFTGYVDSQIPRLEKAKIGCVGNVAYYICSDDATACETALKNLLG